MRFLLSLVLAAMLWAAGPIKLFLKDGSYQLVRSYEKTGDRVKFFSIERNGWEELPLELVDWKATEDANKNEKESSEAKAREIMRQEAADKTLENGPEIAPGINLSDKNGVYAFAGGKLTELPISRAGTSTDKGRAAINILLPAPVLRNRKIVTLPGPKATPRVAPMGVIFVVGKSTEQSRYVLLRVRVKGDHREVEAITAYAMGGRIEHDTNQVYLTETLVNNDTIKLTPNIPLGPGEYAVVEIIDEKLNLYVADFGIDK